MTIRVGIVDDQSLLVSSFRALVETAPDMTVVATAARGSDAIRLANEESIDVLLMDVRMPDMSGLEAAGVISRLPTAPRVLMLTTFNLDEYVTEALRSGAHGFILKDAESDELLDAIRSVHAGQTVLAAEAAAHVATALRALPTDENPRRTSTSSSTASVRNGEGSAVITRREAEVLELVGQGLTNPEIAKRLFIAQTTVKSYVSSLLSKLGCRDRVALAVLANRSETVAALRREATS